jgi:2-dehydropantoate 2-reductase
VDVPADATEVALAKARAFPYATKTSLQRDVEARRRHEGDLFGGAILRLGERHGVSTHCTRRVYARLRG